MNRGVAEESRDNADTLIKKIIDSQQAVALGLVRMDVVVRFGEFGQ